MQKALILIGISGSGKSTIARQFVLDNPTYLRLNRDDFRRSLLSIPLAEYWTWENAAKKPIEELVTTLFDTALTAALAAGWNLVLDNTHLNPKTILDLLDQLDGQAIPVDVSFRLIDTPLPVAIDRDKNRTDGVGEAVIREQHRRLSALRKNQQINPLLARSTVFAQRLPAAQNPLLPRCVLVDIDGTAAKIHDRSPFDWANVGRDKPNEPVLAVVRALRAAGYAIIFMTGRDSVARQPTVAWLETYLGWKETIDYRLFMRPKGDMRKDALVKRELYENHVLGRYFVELVLDDRNQVVALWRNKLGLTCLQVEYGNF